MTDITKYKNVSLSFPFNFFTFSFTKILIVCDLLKIMSGTIFFLILSMSSYVLWLKDTFLYFVISVISFLYQFIWVISHILYRQSSLLYHKTLLVSVHVLLEEQRLQSSPLLNRRSKLDVQRLARGVTWTEVLFSESYIILLNLMSSFNYRYIHKKFLSHLA